MRGGLRGKLVLAMVVVTLAASTVVGLWTQRFTRQQFEQFLEVETSFEPPDVELDPLERYFESRGDWVGVVAELDAAIAGSPGWRALLFDADGRLAASSGGEKQPRATLRDDGALELVQRSGGDDEAVREDRIVIQGGIGLRAGERAIGTLFMLPPVELERDSPEAGFVRQVDRMHYWGIAGTALLALGIGLLLARRIVGPVERLTEATRRLAAGDLTQRVRSSGGDEIAELSRAFNSMAETIENNEQLRRRMVSDVAHELRTPLTHLRCRLETVQDGLRPLDADIVASLHGEIVHLSRLVDDLQELALIDAGRLPMHPVRFDPARLILDLVAACAPAAGQPQVTAELPDAPDAGGALPELVADPDRLRQVLRNLIENARRHTPESGSVTVSATAVGDRLLCAVSDDGAGIAAEHLPRLFERFYRTDPARGRETGGAGLGLAIVKQLVESWGGAIRVDSRPGRGTRVEFDIPLAGPRSEPW